VNVVIHTGWQGLMQELVWSLFRDKLNILIESFYREVEKLRDAAIQVLLCVPLLCGLFLATEGWPG